MLRLEKAKLKEINYLYSPDLLKNGLEHGFLGKAFNFRGVALPESKERFKRLFNVGELFLPEQVHGNEIIDLRNGVQSKLKGDGVRLSNRTSTRMAYGIRTADCLPIIVSSNDEILLVHAGWRGLAKGIIEKAIKTLMDPGDAKIVIGPAASMDKYEVGMEVVEEIGSSASYTSQKPGKVLLSLQETALNQIVSLGIARKEAYVSDICTISDPEFHSWRHDRDHMGSNLTFVIVR